MDSTAAKKSQVLIKDVMTTTVTAITPKMKLWEIAELFIARKISGAPLVDMGGRLISIIGEGALLQLLAHFGSDAEVGHCLKELTPADKMISLKQTDPFHLAYQLFMKHKIHRIPILNENHVVVGLITRGAVLRMIVESHHGKKIPAP